MRKFIPLLLTMALVGCQPAQKKCTDYVDPTIGSISVLLVPAIPTVQLPNQVIRWNPLRTDQTDDQISNFPLTLTSHRQDHVFGFLPIVATTTDGIWYMMKPPLSACRHLKPKSSPHVLCSDSSKCCLSEVSSAIATLSTCIGLKAACCFIRYPRSEA